jgi:hypothetical protein
VRESSCVKICPRCGSAGTDEDVFCEVDGTRLEGSTAPSRTGAPPACPSCGQQDADDGDGYCSSCGHRVGPSAPESRVAVGAAVGPLTVTAARGPDEVLARDHDGRECLLVLGSSADLAGEEAGLQALASCRSLPRVVASGTSEEHGSYLALSLPRREQSLWRTCAPCRLSRKVSVAHFSPSISRGRSKREDSLGSLAAKTSMPA